MLLNSATTPIGNGEQGVCSSTDGLGSSKSEFTIEKTDNTISTTSEECIEKQRPDTAMNNDMDKDYHLKGIDKLGSRGKRRSSDFILFQNGLSLCPTVGHTDFETDKPLPKKQKRAYSWPYSYNKSNNPSLLYATAAALIRRLRINYSTKEQAHDLNRLNSMDKKRRATNNVLDTFYNKFGQRRNKYEQKQFYARQDSGISVATSSFIADDTADLIKIDEVDEDTPNGATSNHPDRDCDANVDTIEETNGNKFPHKIDSPFLSRENIPKMKVAFRYFDASNKLRVFLTDVMNADALCASGKKIFAKISLIPGGRPIKKSTAKAIGTDYTINDVFYFHHCDENVLQRRQLRLKLVEKRRFWSKNKTIGEAKIPLTGFNLTIETTLWCQIHSRRR